MDENVTVLRGKYGATLSISVWDIVVGDIILLSVGQRIPADCLIVESSDFSVVEPE
jgi:magnesium-transporting ATPase (P-type)